jgi:hypothetical protein
VPFPLRFDIMYFLLILLIDDAVPEPAVVVERWGLRRQSRSPQAKWPKTSTHPLRPLHLAVHDPGANDDDGGSVRSSRGWDSRDAG